MFARIVVGVLIGVVAGIFINSKLPIEPKTMQMIQIFIAVIAIAFIAASFKFGAIYGVMAIAEIAGGYFACLKLFYGKGVER
ncbi:hypothetical protein ACPTK4_15605 [Pseudomonas aeruginosa]|uniref:hypothetical protein n=1 Tax=Pseudomonas aeruginosa TaxID=287 RepID=UPI000B9B88FA|nr:hypothetical protein [Pseudomonas aeruginosa]OXU07780.1 hypothetical protein CF337_03225 [Pseudomonas aeruginosa]HEJ5942445.1 hypothetical protein [Pseudomonas aeruginosa]